MKRKQIITTAVLLGLFVTCPSAPAQRLVASVTVDFVRLPQENQNKLIGLEKIIEAYINQREWGLDDYGYNVPLDFEIHFEEAKAISFEDRYSARVVVSNQSNAQYIDRRWEFPLEPGVQLIHSEQFEPFRSFIDYYVFMILGHEFDKVKKFGGQEYFESARRIVQNARFSSRYFLGWDKREEWVEELLSEISGHTRYLNFLYYTGEWLYYDERDREAAKQYLLYAIKQLDKVPEEKLKRFFELNYYNYANALADYREFTALSKLASLDPDHADLYQRLLKKK